MDFNTYLKNYWTLYTILNLDLLYLLNNAPSSNYSITLSQAISEEMKKLLADLRKKGAVGLIGGSDLCKLSEQMGADCKN